MEKVKRQRGRPKGDGPPSENMRIPGPLVPIVKALVAAWNNRRPVNLEPQPQLSDNEQQQRARELAQKILDMPEQQRRDFIAHITDSEQQQAALASGNISLYAAMVALRPELDEGDSHANQA